MIFDTIENAKQYLNVNPDICQMLQAMQAYTPDNYPGGRVDLDGDRLYMNLSSYETRAVETKRSEAHRKYIDVMYMVEGEEIIYVKPTSRLENISMEYNEEKEALLADTDQDVTAVRMTPGCFVVLFPQDAHTPGCHAQGPVTVKKIIGKVRID